MRVLLAHHVVVAVGFASRTDEVGCAEERCGAGAYLGDFGDGGWEGGGVKEDLLVESMSENGISTGVTGEEA